MMPPLEEIFISLLLLIGVVGVYYLLKLHYIFAFGLVEKTDISQSTKEKIQSLKLYLFYFLKVLLFLGLLTVLIFSYSVLEEGNSLKYYLLEWWDKIPEGFWFSILLTLIKIAVLIVLMRYVLKILYVFLNKLEIKSIKKNRYNIHHIKSVYLRIRHTLKYTVVLGVIYRIVHFFPFLEKLSDVLLFVLLLYLCVALVFIVKEVFLMLRTKK